MGEIISVLLKIISGGINFPQLFFHSIKYILTIMGANIVFGWLFYNDYYFIPLTSESLSNYIITGKILQPIISFLISYFFFYGIIFFILRFFLASFVEKIIEEKILSDSKFQVMMEERDFAAYMIIILRKTFQFLIKRGLYKQDELPNGFSNEFIADISKESYLTICLIIQSLTMYAFYINSFNNFLGIVYILVVFLAVASSIIPITLRVFSPFINKSLGKK